MAALPTNFKDDILNASMGGKRRYRQISNADNTISLEDATAYDQVGSDFGAGQINATNKAVNESFNAKDLLKTKEEVAAVTVAGKGVDALVIKDLNDSLIWSLPTANWGTLVDGYYKQIKTVTKVSNPNPIWGLSPAALLPTAAEETAYSLLLYLTVDGNTLTVYAKTKPAANVSIIIKGVA